MVLLAVITSCGQSAGNKTKIMEIGPLTKAENEHIPEKIKNSMEHARVLSDLTRGIEESISDSRFWKKNKMEEIDAALKSAEIALRKVYNELSFSPDKEDQDL